MRMFLTWLDTQRLTLHTLLWSSSLLLVLLRSEEDITEVALCAYASTWFILALMPLAARAEFRSPLGARAELRSPPGAIADVRLSLTSAELVRLDKLSPSWLGIWSEMDDSTDVPNVPKAEVDTEALTMSEALTDTVAELLDNCPGLPDMLEQRHVVC